MEILNYCVKTIYSFILCLSTFKTCYLFLKVGDGRHGYPDDGPYQAIHVGSVSLKFSIISLFIQHNLNENSLVKGAASPEVPRAVSIFLKKFFAKIID